MPQFPAVNTATHFTIEYFNIGRIYEQIKKFAGGINLGYLDNYHERIFEWHSAMEMEINQHIHGSTSNLQNQYFDWVRYCLDIVNSYTDNYILSIIDDYNINAEQKFKAEIENKVAAFQKSKEYLERQHKEEWEEEDKYASHPLYSEYSKYFKTKRVHYKYFIVEKGPDVIDISYVDEYLDFLHKITGNYKRIIEGSLKLWDADKIKSNATMLIVNAQPESQNLALPSQPIEEEKKKLKMKLSVPQLTYLFKLLHDHDMIDETTKVDIAKFITANFSSKKSDQLGHTKVVNKLSDTDKSVANFWADKLMEMYKAAKKV